MVCHQADHVSPVLQISQSKICVTEIPWKLWQSVRSQLSDAETEAVAATASTTDEIAPVESEANPLFSPSDVRAWSAKVTAGNKWGPSARRLRALFMRLLYHGFVGTNSLDVRLLGKGLPRAHSKAFGQLVPALVEAGLLIDTSHVPGTGELVAINPQRLSDIQVLIKREDSEIWMPFLLN
jgi:hypothetical protein